MDLQVSTVLRELPSPRERGCHDSSVEGSYRKLGKEKTNQDHRSK